MLVDANRRDGREREVRKDQEEEGWRREREEGEKDERQPHREDKVGCRHVVVGPAAASTMMLGVSAWVENWPDGSGHVDH